MNLAISLDGFIADDNGGFDWIVGDGNNTLDTKNRFDFEKFVEGIDVVLMGSKCYEQAMAEPFTSKTVYVATSKDLTDTDNVKFINGDIVKVIEQEKQIGKNVFLFGGGSVIDSFIKADVIDEYIIGIIPTVLGSGRKLFYDDNPTIKLNLNEYSISEGVVILQYSKRKS